jgi:ABC-2 type transport system ATP-binding protein
MHRPGLEETFLRVTGWVDGDLARSAAANRPAAGAGVVPAERTGAMS